MSWIADVFKKKPQEWFYGKIPAAQTPNDVELREVKRDEEYLHIYLKSMRIGYARRGLKTYYGAVHSYISLLHRSGKAKFNVVTTPGDLQELDSKRIYNVLNFNKPLLGPIPFRGGNVEVEIGLFSIEAANLAKPFISLLSEMSTLAGVTFISAALPYAGAIEKGINLLAGATDESILEIGISTAYNKIETGYYAVIAAHRDKVNINDIRIAKDFAITDAQGNSLSDYPYIVFEVFTSAKRDDWFDIPEISGAYKKLQEDVNKADYTAAKESLAAFKRAVYFSNDLIRRDSEEIFKQVNDEVTGFLGTTQTGTRSLEKSTELKELKDFKIY